jgi:hypothetical protein
MRGLRPGEAECGGREPRQRVAPDRLGAKGGARIKARVVRGAPCERSREPPSGCRLDEMGGHANRAREALEQGRAKTDQIDIACRLVVGAPRAREPAQTCVIPGLRHRMEQCVREGDLAQ